MANVGRGSIGNTLIGQGNSASPRFAALGTDSGLTAHGVVIAEGNGAFTATSAGNIGQVLASNGAGADPTFQSVASVGGIITITGNDSIAETPTAGNFNLLTANSTIKFSGTSSTETLDFGKTNLLLGSSGSSITSGSQNVALGNNALNSIASGTSNVAVGFSAAQSVTGTQNTAIGNAALQSATSTSNNIAIGPSSLGTYAGTTSAFNIAIGTNALNTTFTGTNNIALGNAVGQNFTTTESSNILFGNVNGTIGDNNTIRIGVQGSGSGQQNKCFIAGIAGVSVSNTQVATIDSTTGQMGSVATLAVAQGGTGQATLTNHGVLVGAGTSAITQLATGSAGQVLQSGGASADPSYSTATYPSTAGTSGNVLTSDGTNWSSAAPANNFVTITGGLTNTQIKNLHASPVTVLSAPGLGKYYQIISFTGKFIYGGSNVFVAGASQTISWYYSTANNPGLTALVSNANLVGTTTRYVSNNGISNLNFTTAFENQPLILYNPIATEISGNAANDNTVTYSLTYQIMNI